MTSLATGSVTVTYDYDDLGRRTTLLRGNGTPGRTTYAYDGASRLTQLNIRNSGSIVPVQSLTFSYNPASQIVSRTSTNDAYAYTGYANGNITDTVNGLNQATSSGGTSISYDILGNLSATGGSTYGYTRENLMTSATVSGATTTLGYDGLMRLNEVIDTSTRRYVYDGMNIIAEYNGMGGLLRRFIYGPGIDEPVASGSGSYTYLIADERGSIVGTANSAGTITPSNSYDEFGITTVSGTVPFRYTGQMWLGAASLYHYRARAYRQQLGRFMQPDPIGYEDGMNLYAYVRSDPINWRDPFGLCIFSSGELADPHSCGTRDTIVTTPIGYGGGSGTGLDRPEFSIPSFQGTSILEPTGCGNGRRITISPLGFGGTLFAGIGGFSAGAEAGISIPISSLREGSLRGLQGFASVSFVEMLGVGAFMGAGSNYGAGFAEGPVTTGYSRVPDASDPSARASQVGAAWGAGAELQMMSGRSPSVSGGAGPRTGAGAYIGTGNKHSWTLATRCL